MTQRVPFQKWRIFWFALSHAYKAGQAKQSGDMLLYEAHAILAQLGRVALRAANNGTEETFLKALDDAEAFFEDVDKDLEAMLDGTHEDVPEWLRKDRK